MATKTPSKGKKTATKESAPKKEKAPKAKAAPKEEPPKAEPEGDEEEDDEDDDEEEAKAATASTAAKKPVPPKPRTPGDDPPPVIPARRLTPEAKARVNEMVAKGVPLGEALRQAATWETFVAPVKEEPAKLVQGRSFEGGERPPKPAPAHHDEDEADDDVEPVVSDDTE